MIIISIFICEGLGYMKGVFSRNPIVGIGSYFVLGSAFVAAVWLSGCAPRAPAATNLTSAVPVSCDSRKDQRSILAMAGSYHVTFDFEETQVLTAGYQKHTPLHTGATELVIVLENSPGHVSLQHLLVIGDSVTKHWRQDWAFEDREMLEFQGKNRWSKRTLSADDARCNWSQAVFEVDDAPRYEGVGRWAHEAQSSVWQSNQTWRPLPRREYTKRSDYDVLLGVNRHRITSAGWDHEQDNIKLVLEPLHQLVHERGLNRYTRIDPSETRLAASYWQATGPFWRQVRDEWARVLEPRQKLQLTTEVAGKRLYELLFERAEDNAASNTPAATNAFIRESVGRYLLEPTARP
ncbi:MAG: DUF6607 family protein [Pseudomonadota bacterium]